MNWIVNNTKKHGLEEVAEILGPGTEALEQDLVVRIQPRDASSHLFNDRKRFPRVTRLQVREREEKVIDAEGFRGREKRP